MVEIKTNSALAKLESLFYSFYEYSIYWEFNCLNYGIHSRYFHLMFLRKVLLGVLIFSCAPPKKMPRPVTMPPVRSSQPDFSSNTLLGQGLITEYEIWEFLREKPSESIVLETLGLPDSVWLDEKSSTKFLYYFISEYQDYNIVEVDADTDIVSGFEWD